MWLVVNAVYKKSKVSNSSSGMNKCASVTLRAKDVWLDIYLKYPVGRANGTMTKSNVRLADLKAILCGVSPIGRGLCLRNIEVWVQVPDPAPMIYGSVAERLMAPVLKTGNRDERFVGSNPTTSAIYVCGITVLSWPPKL